MGSVSGVRDAAPAGRCRLGALPSQLDIEFRSEVGDTRLPQGLEEGVEFPGRGEAQFGEAKSLAGGQSPSHPAMWPLTPRR